MIVRELTETEVANEELADLYPLLSSNKGVRANMATSLDGAVTVEGLSKGLSSPTDRQIFHHLRAFSDTVLVGAGTAMKEKYGPPRRYDNRPTHLPAEIRLAVVADAHKGIDFAHALANPQRPTEIWVRGEIVDPNIDGIVLHRVADGEGGLRQMVGELLDSGEGSVLCEGGPRLLASLLDLGLVAEICLTTSFLGAHMDGSTVFGPLKASVELAPLQLLIDTSHLYGRFRPAAPKGG